MSRSVYHVVYNSQNKVWEIKKESDGSSAILVDSKDTKKEAIDLAKEIISSQIVIHKKDGKIEKEYTYGLDRSFKSTKNYKLDF